MAPALSLNEKTDAHPDNLRILADRVSGVREALSSFASPWVVEFAGMPRAGKSECISIVEHFLRRNKIEVIAPLEGARTAPEFLKDQLVLYNVWTATYALRQLFEGYFSSPRNRFGVLILDRGIFDATAWFQLLHAKGDLSHDDRDALTAFVTLDKWRNWVQQVFVFTCSNEQALQRELNWKLTRSEGRVLKPAFLDSLRDAYSRSMTCNADEFRVFTIDTSNIEPRTVAFRVVDAIFEGILQRARESTPAQAGSLQG